MRNVVTVMRRKTDIIVVGSMMVVNGVSMKVSTCSDDGQPPPAATDNPSVIIFSNIFSNAANSVFSHMDFISMLFASRNEVSPPNA
jgi:hypothetical protein